MEISLFLKEIISESTKFLLKDFHELKNINSSYDKSLNFALSSYRKVIEDFVSKCIEYGQRYLIVLPKFIKVENNRYVPISQIISNSQKLNNKKLPITINDGNIEIEGYQDEYRIVLSPIDGFSSFINGFDFFSTSVSYQEISDNGKFNTMYAFTYYQANNELFLADWQKGLFLNKLKVQNNQIQKNRNHCILSELSQQNMQDIITKKNIQYNSILAINNHNLGLFYIANNRANIIYCFDIYDETIISSGLFAVKMADIKSLKLKSKNSKEFVVFGNTETIKSLIVID
jgi:hypothetical protein